MISVYNIDLRSLRRPPCPPLTVSNLFKVPEDGEREVRGSPGPVQEQGEGHRGRLTTKLVQSVYYIIHWQGEPWPTQMPTLFTDLYSLTAPIYSFLS